MNEKKPPLSIPQVAKLAGVSDETIRLWVKQGRLKPSSLPNKLLKKQRYKFDPDYITQVLQNGLPDEVVEIPQAEAAGLRDQAQTPSIVTTESESNDATQPAAPAPKVSEDETPNG